MSWSLGAWIGARGFERAREVGMVRSQAFKEREGETTRSAAAGVGIAQLLYNPSSL